MTAGYGGFSSSRSHFLFDSSSSWVADVRYSSVAAADYFLSFEDLTEQVSVLQPTQPIVVVAEPIFVVVETPSLAAHF